MWGHYQILTERPRPVGGERGRPQGTSRGWVESQESVTLPLSSRGLQQEGHRRDSWRALGMSDLTCWQIWSSGHKHVYPTGSQCFRKSKCVDSVLQDYFFGTLYFSQKTQHYVLASGTGTLRKITACRHGGEGKHKHLSTCFLYWDSTYPCWDESLQKYLK